MRLFSGIQLQRPVAELFLSLSLVLCGTTGIAKAALGSEPNPPELKLSLRDAIQAAIDNNVNVRLLKERIASAQAQANTSFGALLPNVSGYVSGRNQTVNLGAFGLPPDRLTGLGLRRSVTDPFEVYDARATLVQNIFSLSLIQRWRAPATIRSKRCFASTPLGSIWLGRRARLNTCSENYQSSIRMMFELGMWRFRRQFQ